MPCCPLISMPPLHLHGKNLNKELKHFSLAVAPFFSFFFMGISSIKIAGPQDQLPLQVLSFLLTSSLFYSPESSRRVLTGGLDFPKEGEDGGGGYRACHSPGGRIKATGGQKTNVRHFNTFRNTRRPACLRRENAASFPALLSPSLPQRERTAPGTDQRAWTRTTAARTSAGKRRRAASPASVDLDSSSPITPRTANVSHVHR